MDSVRRAMEVWIVTIIAVLVAVSASAIAPAAPPRSRLLKVPKVYNALITSDIPLLPSRAETAATAAVGPVLLYSTHLPVVLQPQAPGATPQHHLDKLAQLQNQLQREEVDQQRQVQLQRFEELLSERQPVQHLLEQQPVPQLYPERQVPVQPPYPVKQLPVQQQQLFAERVPVRQQHPGRQLSVQQQVFRERFPVPQQHPVRQLTIQQQLFPERRLPLQQPLYPERQQLAGSLHQPLQVQQIPVQHPSTQQLTRQQFDIAYQQKSAHPILQQQYSQIDAHLQQKQLQLQHQKLLQQVKQQKQLQLNEFVDQPRVEQDTSYLPMPETNSYQPPPSVHIDEIKNNKPSNTAIPDVPPPPLPVGKRLQSYSYNSPGLSPPPPTNHHVPYG